IRHLTTQPYRPRTNGKVERFHQTMAREWAYGRAYHSHHDRTAALPDWLDHYNNRRPQLHRRPAPDQPRSQRPWVGQLGGLLREQHALLVEAEVEQHPGAGGGLVEPLEAVVAVAVVVILVRRLRPLLLDVGDPRRPDGRRLVQADVLGMARRRL